MADSGYEKGMEEGVCVGEIILFTHCTRFE